MITKVINIKSSQNVADFVRMIQHFRSEVSTVLIVIGVFALLRSKCVLASHNPILIAWRRRVSQCLRVGLSFTHHLHFFIVIIISIFQCQLWILLDSIGHLFGFETDNVKLAVLFIVDLSLIKR